MKAKKIITHLGLNKDWDRSFNIPLMTHEDKPLDQLFTGTCQSRPNYILFFFFYQFSVFYFGVSRIKVEGTCDKYPLIVNY